jgi:hypothetical protein
MEEPHLENLSLQYLFNKSKEFKENCHHFLTQLQGMFDTFNQTTSAEKRDRYDLWHPSMVKKKAYIDRLIGEMETSKKSIEDEMKTSIHYFSTSKTILKTMIDELNKAQIGTLEELSREAVEKNHLIAENAQQREVLDQILYRNQLNNLVVGGSKILTLTLQNLTPRLRVAPSSVNTTHTHRMKKTVGKIPTSSVNKNRKKNKRNNTYKKKKYAKGKSKRRL